MALQDSVAAGSSIAFRVVTYVFLRWFPGSFLPRVIYTLFAIYIPSFITSFLTQSQYDILEDDIEITVTDVEVDDQPLRDPSTAAYPRDVPSADKPTHIEEEIEVEEIMVVEKRDRKFWRTLLTGLPSPTSSLLSLITLLINVGLILAATDFIYRGKVLYPANDLSFARVGYVSDTEAKLLIREPDQSQLPIFVSIRLHPGVPHDPTAWKSVGGINTLTNETDYTAVLHIPLIRGAEDTQYEWTTSTGHSGFFMSAPKPGAIPEKRDGKFTFVTSSCILPNFPYNPAQHPLGVPGFKHLAKVLPRLGAQFVLLLGDFIYIDVPHRFGASIEDYRQKYRQVYASPDWPSVGQNLSWIHVLDDHEIADNYDAGNTTMYEAAADPWHHYHTAANPPQAQRADTYNQVRSDATYFEFTQGPATFFMMDTRKYRDKSIGENALPANNTEKSMLGEYQLADLLAFLARPVPKGVKWKIVVTSIPFTKNWPIHGFDTWAGYLSERQKILEAMWDVGLRGGVGVVVLSGDRHEFASTAFPPPAGSKWPISSTVTEFSTSPLSQFYSPFPSYRQTDDDDVLVKYIPGGNSKFGVISIENPEASDQSVLKFRLFVEGKEAWTSLLLSPPIGLGKNRGKDALWG